MRNLVLSALAAAILSACTVGPDYVRPEAAEPAAFAQSEPGATIAPVSDAAFWTTFDDATLARLVEETLTGNLDLHAALARLDAGEQPHKSAGFNTGVPAPAGAGLAFVPMFLWLITDSEWFRHWPIVMAWTLFIAALMISSLPTYSWSSIRVRRDWRLFALAGIALLGAALIVAPWHTLLAVAALYLVMIPFGLASYARVKRRRATQPERA